MRQTGSPAAKACEIVSRKNAPLPMKGRNIQLSKRSGKRFIVELTRPAVISAEIWVLDVMPVTQATSAIVARGGLDDRASLGGSDEVERAAEQQQESDDRDAGVDQHDALGRDHF